MNISTSMKITLSHAGYILKYKDIDNISVVKKSLTTESNELSA